MSLLINCKKMRPLSSSWSRANICPHLLVQSSRFLSTPATQITPLRDKREYFQKPKLNTQYYEDSIESIRQNIKTRKVEADIDKVVGLIKEEKALIARLNIVDAERQVMSTKIQALMGDTDTSSESLREFQLHAKQLRYKGNEIACQITQMKQRIGDEGVKIPNDTHPDSPIGPEDQAKIVSSYGEKKLFSFKPLDYNDLCKTLRIVDFEAGSLVTGNSFYYLKDAAALLELALIQYSMGICVAKGFFPVIGPDIVRKGVAEACGYQPRYSDEEGRVGAYNLASPFDDRCLVGTAEVSIAGFLMNKSFRSSKLPEKYVAFGRSFRPETVHYGAKTRGLYRVHQFSKVEMYAVTTPDPNSLASNTMLEELIGVQKDILNGLDLHYRVLDMPTEELGASAYRKYDIQAWLPGRNIYGEICSASNVTDFQSRRLNIQCSSRSGLQFAHTLNATACAIPRIIIALLETHQQEDGTVCIPKALQPWMGGMKTIVRSRL